MSYSYSSEMGKPANFSSGWNDPPELDSGNPPSSINMNLKRQKRPVDPSSNVQKFNSHIGTNNSQYSSPNVMQQPHSAPTFGQSHIQQQIINPTTAVQNYSIQQPIGGNPTTALMDYNQSTNFTSLNSPQYQQSIQHQPILQYPQSSQPQSNYHYQTQITPSQFSTHPASAFTPTVPSNQTEHNQAYPQFPQQHQTYNPIQQG